jgi:hypothetical protein
MPDRKRARPVILAVSSGGGHWVQMQRLAPAFAGADVHYATTDATAAAQIDGARIHVFPDANKDTPLRLRCASCGWHGSCCGCVPTWSSRPGPPAGSSRSGSPA